MTLRGQARGTMANANAKLNEAGELLDDVSELVPIGKAILERIDIIAERLDRITAAIEANGIRVGAEVAGHELPGELIVKPNDEGE